MTEPLAADHQPFDHSQIDENVFIGTNACCQMHFDSLLLQKGVTCDISLEEEHLDMPHGADIFLWLPTKDMTPPERRKFEVGAVALEEMVRDGYKVFIHCKNGHGRAPTFYIAYLILKQHLSLDAAFEAVKSHRPTMHLEPSQMEFLKSVESSCTGGVCRPRLASPSKR